MAARHLRQRRRMRLKMRENRNKQIISIEEMNSAVVNYRWVLAVFNCGLFSQQ